ncbi:MAG TPA: hypothetical protein VH370_20550 [Humisphaera sp.]|nr:hypothetical protein [Humisphaera sp.]
MAVVFNRLGGRFHEFGNDSILMLKDASESILNDRQDRVFPHPPAAVFTLVDSHFFGAEIIAVTALGVLALDAVALRAALAIDQPRKRRDAARAAVARIAADVRGILGALAHAVLYLRERLIGNDPQGFILPHKLRVGGFHLRNAPTSGAVQLHLPRVVSHATGEQGIDQHCPHGSKRPAVAAALLPLPAAPDASGSHALCDRLESDRFAQIPVNDFLDDDRLARINFQKLPPGPLYDVVSVGCNAAGEGALLEALDKTFAGAVRKLPGKIFGNHKLDPTRQRVRSFGGADKLHATIFQRLRDDMGIGGAAQPIKFVNEDAPDLPGFRVRQQREQLRSPAHRAARLGAVDELFARAPGGSFTLLYLDVNRCALILCV